MKKFLKYFGFWLISAISGVAIMVLVGNIMFSHNDNAEMPGLVLFEEAGECLSGKNLEVFQGLGDKGLAHEVDTYDSIVYLILDVNGNYFYDGQIVKNPAGKCAKQVGIYEYRTKDDVWKTVPVVVIENK